MIYPGKVLYYLSEQRAHTPPPFTDNDGTDSDGYDTPPPTDNDGVNTEQPYTDNDGYDTPPPGNNGQQQVQQQQVQQQQVQQQVPYTDNDGIATSQQPYTDNMALLLRQPFAYFVFRNKSPNTPPRQTRRPTATTIAMTIAAENYDIVDRGKSVFRVEFPDDPSLPALAESL